ncbi:MAG: hypothetical protein Ta2A_06690 [Treponemataceae bacterium]|nr:MAG: hypothetical protein Ta2A_06690 [Treponemataceae bacterium]
MTTSIKAIGLNFREGQEELISKKLERIHYAESLIVDLSVHVKEEKKFIFESTVHFRWGAQVHVASDDYDFEAALNKLVDVLDQKVKKEKEKIQEKK